MKHKFKKFIFGATILSSTALVATSFALTSCSNQNSTSTPPSVTPPKPDVPNQDGNNNNNNENNNPSNPTPQPLNNNDDQASTKVNLSAFLKGVIYNSILGPKYIYNTSSQSSLMNLLGLNLENKANSNEKQSWNSLGSKTDGEFTANVFSYYMNSDLTIDNHLNDDNSNGNFGFPIEKPKNNKTFDLYFLFTNGHNVDFKNLLISNNCKLIIVNNSSTTSTVKMDTDFSASAAFHQSPPSDGYYGSALGYYGNIQFGQRLQTIVTWDYKWPTT